MYPIFYQIDWFENQIIWADLLYFGSIVRDAWRVEWKFVNFPLIVSIFNVTFMIVSWERSKIKLTAKGQFKMFRIIYWRIFFIVPKTIEFGSSITRSCSFILNEIFKVINWMPNTIILWTFINLKIVFRIMIPWN